MALRVKKTTTMHIDEGEYKAIVSGVQKSEGKFGEFVKWSFMVKDAMSDGDPIEEPVRITGRTSLTLNPKSKLYAWCKACGLEVDGDDVDVEEALKKGVRLIVADKVSNSGETISVVTKVMSLKKKKAVMEDDEDAEESPPPQKTKKPAKVEDDEDEDEAPPKKASKRAPTKEEDEEEEKPVSKPPKKAKAAPKEEEDDDEDEAPPKKSKKSESDDDDLDDLFDFDDDE